MYNKFIIFLALSLFSFLANAATVELQDLPDRIMNYIHKKHPQAKNITAKQVQHFNLSLYEVNFTEERQDRNNKPYSENISELFRTNGHFFVNAPETTNTVNLVPSNVTKTLQAHYPNYQVLSMKIIPNPNGLGEEYEILLQVAKQILPVSIDYHGELSSN